MSGAWDDPGTASRLRHVASHTGLRGIAALLVVFYHFQYGAEYRLPLETMTEFFWRGYLWVDLFFVLSGFIISYTGAADRHRPFTAVQTKRFLIARLARIYPLHFFCLAYLTLFVTAGDLGFAAIGKPPPFNAWAGDGGAAFAAQLMLIHAWLPLEPAWNIPSWSISAELFAYLLFPLLVSFHTRARTAARAILLLLPLLFYAHVATKGGDLDIVNLLAPWRCVAGFSLGMLIYFHRDAIERLSTRTLSVLQLIACIAVFTCLTFAVNDVAIIPAFVLLVASTWPDRGVVAKLLGMRPCMFLGEISYSVYLNHVCLLTAFALFWGRLAARLPMIDPAIIRVVELSLATTIILLFSRWTFRYVEAPARMLITTRMLGRRPRVSNDLPAAP